MNNAPFEQIADALRASERVVICGHVSPDGDCLGSQLALAGALRQMGKHVTCLLALKEEIDFGLRFLPGIDQMVPAADFNEDFDTFVTVDVPNANRMGDAACALHASAQRTITIDHHECEEAFSQVSYVDPSAAATAILIWQLIQMLDVEITNEIATCCYVGVLTDTGRFQYQNTTADVLRVAADIVACGADPADIARQVYQNRSRQSLALEQRMLGNLEFMGNGSCAVSHLMRSDFVETGANKADAEPLIDALRSLRGIRVACILRQQSGSVRGSLRAKDDTDVAEIARKMGGGGHKAAAGFTFNGTVDEAREVLRRELDAL